MKWWQTQNMWISDYNDELTEFVTNIRLYGDLQNMKFFVKNTLKRYYEYTGFYKLIFKNIYYQKYKYGENMKFW
jgi:hypothetical protein